MLTRRRINTWLMASALGDFACAQTTNVVPQELSELVDHEQLVVLTMTLDARAIDGTQAGRLALDDFSGLLAISPDANAVGWIPRDPLLHGGKLPNASAWVLADNSPPQRYSYDGRTASAIGLSRAGNIYLVIERLAGGRRLVMLSPSQPNAQEDLSDIVSGYNLTGVEWLNASNDGFRLALGWRDAILVMDTNSRTILFTGVGRFPCLDPDGARVAFVDNERRLILGVLSDQSKSVIQTGGAVDGVGGWAPDGQSLLAGVRDSFALSRRLAVIDPQRGEVLRLWNIGDDYGSRSHWISRRLLRPA